MSDVQHRLRVDLSAQGGGISPARDLAKSEVIRALCEPRKTGGMIELRLRIDGDDLAQLFDECDKIEAAEKATKGQ